MAHSSVSLSRIPARQFRSPNHVLQRDSVASLKFKFSIRFSDLANQVSHEARTIVVAALSPSLFYFFLKKRK